MFLQLVRRETAWKISYILSPESFVPTLPPGTFRQFVHQRARHFSTGKYLSIPQVIFFVCYHGSNLLLLLTVPLAIIFPSIFWIGCFGILKFFADVLLLLPNFSTFKTKQNILLMEVLYMLYNTFIGPLGLVASFDWKSGMQHQAAKSS